MSHGNALSNKVANDLGKRLLEAARHGNTEEVNNLMRNGAPLTTDWLGTTPLHLAAIYGHTSTAAALIKSGISRDGRTKVDKAPLHFACQHGHVDIVKMLVSGGAHVNAADMLKMTPLHWGVEANNFDICLILLNAGVNTEAKNKFDKTPLRIARDKGYHTILQLLNDDKFKMLQDIDVLHASKLYERSINSMKMNGVENVASLGNAALKKPKTRRFPMVAGTWTGGDAQTQERIEMSDRKRLRVFKKKTQPQEQQQQHENGTPLSGSPLQQEVESNVTTASSTRSSTPSTSSVKTSVGDIDVNSLRRSDKLYNGIPVISSLTLKSLPANIHAIPLNITTDDLRKEKIIDSKVEECFKNQRDRPVPAPLNIVNSSKPTATTPDNSSTVTTHAIYQKPVTIETVAGPAQKNHQQSTIPFNIPVDLLNQIANGDIMLHSLPNKSIDTTTTTLAGIKTEMGTIPIIPVTGEGGLQLIPLENGSNSIEKDVQKNDDLPVTTASSTALASPFLQNSAMRSPVFVPNQAKYSLQIHGMHGGMYNTSGGGFVHPQPAQIAAAPAPTSTVVSAPSSVPTPMLVPTGIYLPPGHPGMLQIQRQPTPYSPVTYSHHNFVVPSMYPHYGHGHTPPGILPQAIPPNHQILVHPTMQPTFLQPHVQPQVVFVERPGALNPMGPFIRPPESPQCTMEPSN